MPIKGGAPYEYKKYTQKNKTKNTTGIHKRLTLKPKLSATKTMNEIHHWEFPIFNETLDHSKRDLMKLFFNLWSASSSSLKILWFCSFPYASKQSYERHFPNMVFLLTNLLNFHLRSRFLTFDQKLLKKSITPLSSSSESKCGYQLFTLFT